jgi:hypothetical protein
MAAPSQPGESGRRWPASFFWAQLGRGQARETHFARRATPPTLGDAGIHIANAKGVPGTLGCFARRLRDRQIVMLSSWHILFGNGGQEDGEVWMVDEAEGARRYSEIGRTLQGKVGKVRLRGADCHVDCAISSWAPSSHLGAGKTNWIPVNGHDTAQPGDLVTKKGAATGTTVGVVAATDYCDFAWIGGRSHPASGQLLVRSVDHEAVFCAKGDSGSVLVNTSGKAVGLLWGANSRGDGVACPMSAVLDALNITLELTPPQSK